MLCISSALFAPANKSAKLESSGWADIGSLAEIDEGRNSNKTTPRNLCDAISYLTTLGNKTFWVSIAEAIFIVILLTASGWQYDDGDMCTWGVGRPCLENEEVHSFFFTMFVFLSCIFCTCLSLMDHAWIIRGSGTVLMCILIISFWTK